MSLKTFNSDFMKVKNIIFVLLCQVCTMQAQDKVMMLVGTYTYGSSKGIYSCRFNQTTGETELLDSLEMRNPSYLTVSRDGSMIYAVSETNDEKASLNIISLNKKGGMRLLDTAATEGGDPCYVAQHKSNNKTCSNFPAGIHMMYIGEVINA